MESVANTGVHIVEAGFDIVPEDGRNILDVLAESKITGYKSILINDNNTAYVLLYERPPVEGVTVGGD